MSGANHIVGGVVFTGIYLSMFDVNILSNPMYLAFTALFAILADIDHTKTPIGKAFYPVAKYLDKKFGHRTITHSLLFYFVAALIVGIVEMLIKGKSGVYTQIFLWSYGSHLIFDMVTKQGVPLFYPFKKAPCVIPANPDFRFRSSCIKTEATIFVVFIALGFSCQNLFAQGFWNTYNRTFDNVRHIFDEVKKTSKIVQVDYSFMQEGKKFEGIADVLEASPSDVLIFDEKAGFIKINNNSSIISKLLPIRTNRTLSKKEQSFTGISMDSLRHLTLNKKIVALKIQSVLPVYFTKDNQPQSSTSFSLEYIKNPAFKSDRIDSVDLEAAREISEIDLQIQQTNEAYNDYLTRKAVAESDLKITQAALKSDDLAERQKAIEELQQKQNAVKSLEKPMHNNNKILLLRKQFLQSKLHIKKEQSVNGYISYYETN